jgi:hypothetical protein
MFVFVIFGTLCYSGLRLRDPRVQIIPGGSSTELVRFCKWSAVLGSLRTTFAFHSSLIERSDESS